MSAWLSLVQVDEVALLLTVKRDLGFTLSLLILIFVIYEVAKLLSHDGCFLHARQRVLLLTLLYVRKCCHLL